MHFLILFVISLINAAIDPYNLLPYPAAIKSSDGKLVIDSRLTMSCIAANGQSSPASLGACKRFLQRLQLKTGIDTFSLEPKIAKDQPSPATIRVTVSAPGDTIRYDGRDIEYPDYGVDESYTVTVSSSNAIINASTPFGAMHALETLVQLVSQDSAGFSAPACVVDDRPRFKWRGVMLDVVRHWMPIDVVMRTLTAMRICKMNVLHLHLSDDQGIRVHSTKYPQLTAATTINNEYFTADDVRRIVAHAAALGIRVVPEFDLPAHSSSWLVRRDSCVDDTHNLTVRVCSLQCPS
jgi:hexosaminidase